MLSLVIPGRAHGASKTRVNALMGANPESIARSAAKYGFRARRFAASRNDEC